MSNTRETVKHAAIYSFAGMMGKVIGFVMLPIYAHKLDASGYGVIGMMEASTALLTSLLGYGFQSVLTRIYHEQKSANKGIAISTGYWTLFLLTAMLVALSMIASSPIAALMFGDPSLNLILCIALLAFFLDMCGQTAATILVVQRKSILYSLLNLIRLACGLSLNIAFIVVLDWGIYGYFMSSVITSLISFILFQRLCFRECGTAIDKPIAKQILLFQLPLVPSSLIAFASLQSERIMLRFIESIEKVGVLEMGYKFPSLLTMLIHTPLITSWNTERIRIAEEADASAPARIGEMITLSFYLMTFGGLLISLSIGDILVILTPENFWQAKRIAQTECATLIVSSVVHHVNFGYLYTKDSKAWAKLTATTAILKIGLSFFFITNLGILGAAYSALCAAIVLLITASIGGQHRYRIQYRHVCNFVIGIGAIALFCISELLGPLLLDISRSIAGAIIGSPRWMNAISSVTPSSMLDVLIVKLPNIIDASFHLGIGCLFLLLLPYAHPSMRVWLQKKLNTLGY